MHAWESFQQTVPTLGFFQVNIAVNKTLIKVGLFAKLMISPDMLKAHEDFKIITNTTAGSMYD